MNYIYHKANYFNQNIVILHTTSKIINRTKFFIYNVKIKIYLLIIRLIAHKLFKLSSMKFKFNLYIN